MSFRCTCGKWHSLKCSRFEQKAKRSSREKQPMATLSLLLADIPMLHSNYLHTTRGSQETVAASQFTNLSLSLSLWWVTAQKVTATQFIELNFQLRFWRLSHILYTKWKWHYDSHHFLLLLLLWEFLKVQFHSNGCFHSQSVTVLNNHDLKIFVITTFAIMKQPYHSRKLHISDCCCFTLNAYKWLTTGWLLLWSSRWKFSVFVTGGNNIVLKAHVSCSELNWGCWWKINHSIS